MSDTPRRFGVFGGSFDPVHIGHLVLAESARERHGLARVLFMLTPDPPHKPATGLTPYTQRLAMLRRAMATNPGVFAVSTIESERQGPHYTVETLSLLKERHADEVDEWFFLIGGDMAHTLPTWRRPAELLAQMRLCVVSRPGADLGELRTALTSGENPLCDRAQVQAILDDAATDSPLMGVSATDIRDRCAAERSIRYLVPDGVRDYIHDNQLYQD